MSNLISVPELREALHDPSLRLADVRFDLADPAAGARAYAVSHLPGAIHIDLDRDLSGPVAAVGGRHPLPAMEAFAARMGALGIGSGHRVVAYDDRGGLFAGRLWWLLRYAGHDRVRILDGGLPAWLEAGLEQVTTAPRHPAARFKLALRPDMVVDREHVLRQLENPAALLVDARAAARYRGEVEPIDPVAGHIPTALNRPYPENLEDGRFKPAAALRERFDFGEGFDEVVMYCGSGVSAIHNLVAMEEAGLPLPKLYPGSWSDWVSYPEALIATGDQEPTAE